MINRPKTLNNMIIFYIRFHKIDVKLNGDSDSDLVFENCSIIQKNTFE